MFIFLRLPHCTKMFIFLCLPHCTKMFIFLRLPHCTKMFIFLRLPHFTKLFFNYFSTTDYKSLLGAKKEKSEFDNNNLCFVQMCADTGSTTPEHSCRVGTPRTPVPHGSLVAVLYPDKRTHARTHAGTHARARTHTQHTSSRYFDSGVIFTAL